ncbi:hypothetical protein P7C73_g2731, partial [Tremellales sp. Uapishka_1]
MALLFPPDRKLLHPQFETYKLHSLSPSDVPAFPLPGKATQSRIGYHQHHLSFKQVRHRISFDHLFMGGGTGLYIDENWDVITFELNDAYEPVFSKVASVPTPLASSSTSKDSSQPQAEFPAAVYVAANHWAISSGSGSLYILDTSSSTFVARYDLPTPFLVHSAHFVSTHEARILLSRAVHVDKKQSFELIEISIDVTLGNGVDAAPDDLEERINWRKYGGDIPIWCEWREDGWTVLASEEFTSGSPVEADQKAQPNKADKSGLGAAPHSWTQDSSTVSISIPLPPDASISKSDIAITFTANTVSIQIPSVPSLSSTKSLWTTISPSSTWTFDPAAHLVDITLFKADENTRWPSVYDTDDDDDIPETLSADLLESVKQSFNAIKTRSSAEEIENPHPTLPGLLREEMEFDLEDGEDFGEGEAGGKVGREFLVGSLSAERSEWSRQSNWVISTPLEGSEPNHHGIVVKNAVDGLFFRPSDTLDSIIPPWTHTSTCPALAFVLSSKRDLRLIRHLTIDPHHLSEAHETKKARVDHRLQTTVLAFESSGNVYVYYPVSGERVLVARQGVTNVSGGEKGELLGCGLVDVGTTGQKVVVALCERELVVLQSVL